MVTYIYSHICIFMYIYIYIYIHTDNFKINRLRRMCFQSSREQSGSIILTVGSFYAHTFDTGVSNSSVDFDQTSIKLRPDFDQISTISTPPVSKFGRGLLGLWMNHVVKLIRCRPNCGTKLRPNCDTKLRPNCDTKLRPNFGTGVSKFGRYFDQASTWLRQAL